MKPLATQIIFFIMKEITQSQRKGKSFIEQKLTKTVITKNLLGHCARSSFFSYTTYFHNEALEETRVTLASEYMQQLHCVLIWSVLLGFYLPTMVSI